MVIRTPGWVNPTHRSDKTRRIVIQHGAHTKICQKLTKSSARQGSGVLGRCQKTHEKCFLLPKLLIDHKTTHLGDAHTAEKSGTAPNFAVPADGTRWRCANTCAEGVVGGSGRYRPYPFKISPFPDSQRVRIAWMSSPGNLPTSPMRGAQSAASGTRSSHRRPDPTPRPSDPTNMEMIPRRIVQ